MDWDILVRILNVIVFTILIIVCIKGIKRGLDRDSERPKAPDTWEHISPVKPGYITDSATGEMRPMTPEEKE